MTINCSQGELFNDKKYGKSLDDIRGIKQNFIDNNSALLKDNLILSSIARKQPKREKCKNCNTCLDSQELFIKHDIKYYLCKICNHLNGEFEDTTEYAEAVYEEEITSNSKTYSSKD